MTAIAQSGSDPDPNASSMCSTLLSVEHRLRRSSYKSLSRVCFEFQTDSGILHLRGSLPSYYLKQVAQELVRDLEGVRIVNNHIKVARPSTNKM
jgi:osmotically-inducible protein OsmY